ncbi:MAG: hypothetical protein JWM64_2973 [Frankiales bacterium]|nr:hypothetical protein [Frankiales bacterium]
MRLRTTLTGTVLGALLLPLAPAGALSLPPASTPSAAPTTLSSPTTTLAALGYGETALRGTYGSAEVFVPLPAGTQPQGDTRVDLVFDHSPLLTPRSTLTVLAGGVAVGSARLGAGNQQGGHLTATVPASLVGSSGLALSLRGYLRLTDDDCEEADNPAQWVTVRRTSVVGLASAAAPRRLDTVQELLTGGSTRSVAVEPADAAVLGAAGVVAAQVGRWQGEARKDALVLPAVGAPSVRVAAGTPSAAGPGGVLAVVPTGGVQLLVGGGTPADVDRAARTLASRSASASLSGPAVVVGEGQTAAPLDRRSLPWQDGAASLAQLGIDRQDVVGLGAREVALQVDRPAGWTVGRGARVDLVVDAGAGLRERTSTVQLLVGGVDLGTRRLQPGAGPTSYRFRIPDGLADRRLDGRPLRALDLTVRFLLDVPQDRCQPLDPEAARASVLPTTTVRLPHGDYDGRELARFPHPLATGSDERVTVVLPRDPDSATVRAGLQVAAAVGRWSDPGSPAPALVTAATLTRAQRKGGLVLLGDADRQLGEQVDLGRSATRPTAGATSALLGLVDSPLDGDRTALVVHGDAAGLLLAARTLGSRAGLASLRGDHAALVGGASPVTLSRAEGERPPAALAPVVGGPWYSEVRPWTVPALVVLVGLLVVLGLVARARWRPRR